MGERRYLSAVVLYEVLDELRLMSWGCILGSRPPRKAEAMINEKQHMFEDNASGYCGRLERVELIVVAPPEKRTFWLPVVGALFWYWTGLG